MNKKQNLSTFVLVCVSVIILLVDQLFKNLALKILPGQEKALIPGVLKITNIKNTGAALGLFDGKRWLLITVSLVVLALLIYFIAQKKIKGITTFLAVAFIVGGGFSNLVDRVFRGAIVDYLKLSFFGPVCNLADYFITIGAVLLVVILIKPSKNKKCPLHNKN